MRVFDHDGLRGKGDITGGKIAEKYVVGVSRKSVR